MTTSNIQLSEDVLDSLAHQWTSRSRQAPGDSFPVCRTGIYVVDDTSPATTRFGFVSLASSIERLLSSRSLILDLDDGTGSRDTLFSRLLDGEVAAVIVRGAPPVSGGQLPDELTSARRSLRRELTDIRFLLRQVALDEVSSDRGASDDLVASVREQWTTPASIVIDVAMQLTLGADRQRYVDRDYALRAEIRLTSVFRRLVTLGVRSNPMLAIG